MRRGTVALLLTLLAVAAVTPGTGAVAEPAGTDAVAAKKKCKKKGKGRAAAAKKCRKKKGGGKLPPLPRLSIDPASHNYGFMPLLTPSTKLFTVSNAPGTDTAGPFQVTVSGPNASNFTVSENGCNLGTHLQGGESCTFKVTFVPSSPTTVSATVVVEAGVGGGVSAGVSGAGIP